jgi:hypothetical protein
MSVTTNPWRVLQALEQLAKEPGRGLGVPPRGDQNVQDIPVLVDGAPQVPPLTVDREEYLVEVPRIAGPGPTATQPVGVGLPNFAHHCRMVSWETTIQRCSIIFCTSRKLSGNR